MSENPDERRALEDIASLASVLDHSLDSLSSAYVGYLGDLLIKQDHLFVDYSWSEDEETEEDGPIRELVHFAFAEWIGPPTGIPLISGLRDTFHGIGSISDIPAKYHLIDDELTHSFFDFVLLESAGVVLNYCLEVGEFSFYEDEMDTQFPGQHLLSQCADVLRGSAKEVVTRAFISWVKEYATDHRRPW